MIRFAWSSRDPSVYRTAVFELAAPRSVLNEFFIANTAGERYLRRIRSSLS